MLLLKLLPKQLLSGAITTLAHCSSCNFASDKPSSSSSSTVKAPSSPFEVNSSRQLFIAQQRAAASDENTSQHHLQRSLPEQSKTQLTPTASSTPTSSSTPTVPTKKPFTRGMVRAPPTIDPLTKGPSSIVPDLQKKDLPRMLAQVNNLSNSYKLLDKFSENDILKVVSDESVISNPDMSLALNNIWSYSRKNRIMHSYRTPAFEMIARTISKNLDKLESPLQVSAFAFNLFKVNHEDLEPYQRIEHHILETGLDSFPLPAIAQILFSFNKIARSQTDHDFSGMFSKAQVVLALKLRAAADAIVTKADVQHFQKDFSQILAAYSKSQNLSSEFLFVLDHLVANHVKDFDAREKMITLHSFAVNNYRSNHLIDVCANSFIQDPHSYNMQEISHLVVSLHQFDSLSEEILVAVREQFLLKRAQLNLLDLSDICSVFFQLERVDDEMFTVTREVFRTLRSNVEMNIIHKLLKNASSMLNKELMPHRFFKTLMDSLQIISFSKDLTGRLIDELRLDAVKILHPQFKQLYLDTLANKKKLSLKELKSNKKEDKEKDKKERRKQHFKLESARSTRAKQENYRQKNDDQKQQQQQPISSEDLESFRRQIKTD